MLVNATIVNLNEFNAQSSVTSGEPDASLRVAPDEAKPVIGFSLASLPLNVWTFIVVAFAIIVTARHFTHV